jgi:hypothetical protein
MVDKVDTFCIVVLFAVTWLPPGQCGASSRPMAAFSGFYESPGPPLSDDALCIASMCPHGHQNGPERRYICSMPPSFLIAVIIAYDHIMVHKDK